MSRLLVGSATDVGLVRSNNQDQLLVAPGLYAVADGMGGHAAGEVASATAITALQAAFDASDVRTAESLRNAAQAANRAVWEQARSNRRMLGMGTTLVALAVVERQDATTGLAIAHIGDSRVYRFRDDVLAQLTIDHSLVQELVDEGQISPDQAAMHPHRHVLTRALGVEPRAEVDLIELGALPGDRYVLCSDGLPREVPDEQIASVLRRFAAPEDAAKELVDLANSAGGSDNVTVVVVDVVANDAGPETLLFVPGPARGRRAAAATSGQPMARSGGEDEPGPDGVEDGTVADIAPTSSPQPVREPGPRAGPAPLTWRAVSFVVALLILAGGAVACLAWYARSSYYVTISSGHLEIFQGRPGGVLWFGPTLTQRTRYTASSVEPYWLPTLESGQPEPSMNQAELYITRLVSEKREAEAVTPQAAKGPPRAKKEPATTPGTAKHNETRTTVGGTPRKPA